MDAAPDHFRLDDGSERWEVDGRLHREDGPALITPEGERWFMKGVELTPEETAAKIAQLAAAKQTALAEAMKEGTARPVTAMKPIQFKP